MNLKARLSLFACAAALVVAATLYAQAPTIDASIQLHNVPLSGGGDHWLPMAVNGAANGSNQVFVLAAGYTREVEVKLNGVEMLQANQLPAGAQPNITVMTTPGVSGAAGMTTINFLSPIPGPADVVTAWGTL